MPGGGGGVAPRGVPLSRSLTHERHWPHSQPAVRGGHEACWHPCTGALPEAVLIGAAVGEFAELSSIRARHLSRRWPKPKAPIRLGSRPARARPQWPKISTSRPRARLSGVIPPFNPSHRHKPGNGRCWGNHAAHSRFRLRPADRQHRRGDRVRRRDFLAARLVGVSTASAQICPWGWPGGLMVLGDCRELVLQANDLAIRRE
jgi:hypothetical protein